MAPSRRRAGSPARSSGSALSSAWPGHMASFARTIRAIGRSGRSTAIPSCATARGCSATHGGRFIAASTSTVRHASISPNSTTTPSIAGLRRHGAGSNCPSRSYSSRSAVGAGPSGASPRALRSRTTGTGSSATSRTIAGRSTGPSMRTACRRSTCHGPRSRRWARRGTITTTPIRARRASACTPARAIGAIPSSGSASGSG